MENNKPLQAEEMLEKIFYYMNQLIEEKEFIPTIRLLTDLGRTLVNAERASFWYWDRAEKIRTYNFPQGRVTDHRINLTLYKLDKILNGDIQEIIDACVIADQTAKLEKMNN